MRSMRTNLQPLLRSLFLGPVIYSASLVGAQALEAAQPPQEDLEPYVETLDVNIVNIEAHAEFQQARQQFIFYANELLMGAGSQDVAIGVRDDYSGGASYLRESVVIGPQ